jgi:hypothetical protein
MPKAITPTAVTPPAKKTAARKKSDTAARSATVRAKRAPADDEPLTGPVVDEIADELLDETADGRGYTTRPMRFGEAAPAGTYTRPDRPDVEVAEGLSFTSTKKDRDAEGVGEQRGFEIDGETYVFHRPPDDTFVLLSVAGATTTPMADRIAAMVEFLAEATDEEDFLRLRARIKNPADNFGFTDLFDMIPTIVQTFPQRGAKMARSLARQPRR